MTTFIKPNDCVFYLFHSKTGLVAAVVSKDIAGGVGVWGSYPQRPGGQQLEGASPLPVFPPVREPCRQCCPTVFKRNNDHYKGSIVKRHYTEKLSEVSE